MLDRGESFSPFRRSSPCPARFAAAGFLFCAVGACPASPAGAGCRRDPPPRVAPSMINSPPSLEAAGFFLAPHSHLACAAAIVPQRGYA
jgi:hypothetical protein